MHSLEQILQISCMYVGNLSLQRGKCNPVTMAFWPLEKQSAAVENTLSFHWILLRTGQ